ncbi:dystrobrevin alpha-like [Dermatophagoides pteronyssinus]|uniref:dystrobrevin alpha-like n=1 Tax=Dermatophagoides pteronyssinus TaxID=6956 RepID=UPI003F664BC3
MYDSNIQIRIERYKKTIANYDSIRFKPYKIASKLKFLRNESKFYLIDLYNTIESFREFGLNSDLNLNPDSVISSQKIQSILYSIFHHFSRRSSTTGKDIDIDYSVALIYNWLMETFAHNHHSNDSINILAFKISLILLCSSLLSNKLKYFFTLLSNENGFIDQMNFSKFLHNLNDLCNHFDRENPVDFNNEIQQNFTGESIDLKHFIDVFQNFDNQNDLTGWLIVYHRLFDSEQVVHHNIQCDCCGKNPVVGFRYKCKICHNYNQCQDCFWTGKSTKNHDPDFHPCKEYLFDKSRKHLRQSFRRSFRKLLPKHHPAEEENPESSLGFNQQNSDKMIMKKLNLSEIVSPKFYHKNKHSSNNFNEFKLEDYGSDYQMQLQFDGIDKTENEHLLIEHYLNILRDDNHHREESTSNGLSLSSSDSESYEKIISELERKNRQLMLNISELNSNEKSQREQNVDHHRPVDNSNEENYEENFFNELSSLRKKKTDLETYLICLQDQRKNLMFQLDDLMKELKIGQ